VGPPVLATADDASANGECASATRFQSLTLTDAVTQTLRNEPHLLLARQDVEESKADITAAVTPFLPKGQILLDDERFVPNHPFEAVTVVGNNILGGTKTYSGYGAISVSWNISDSGRDVAGYYGAQAELRSSSAALYSQLDDTLGALLKGYAEVYEARLSVRQRSTAVDRLRTIETRAEERFRHGDGTTVAIGQAREATLDAEQALYQTCSTLTDKSLALAKAMGVRLPVGELLVADSELPDVASLVEDASNPEAAIENDPEVISAREKVTEAEAKLKEAHSAFGPVISIDARRDYLGQNVDSLTSANHTISPNSYRIGISLTQPIFPFTSEASAIGKARAEVRKAQVSADQARSNVDAKLRTALAARAEAGASYRAAQTSVTEAEQVLRLTQSQYRAGRTDKDAVEHAELDLEKAQLELSTLASHRILAEWDLARTFQATRFAYALLHQVGIEFNDVLAN
jgi:outer membrane protein TolC